MPEKRIGEILSDEDLRAYDLDPAKVKELSIDDVNNLSQCMMEAVRKKKPAMGAMCCCSMCCCAAATRPVA